jgi:putative endopeptidase
MSINLNLKDDFYTYVNNKWLNNIKLDDSKAKITEFTILHEKNNKKIKKIILKNKLLKHIYKLGVSEKKFDVVFPLIDFIKSNDFETTLAYLTNIGIDHLFDINVNENLFDNKKNIVYFDQPSLSINKDIYNNPNIYNEYKKYVYKYGQILKRYHINIDIKNILKYEKQLNNLLKSLEEHRNINEYYTLIKYNDFTKKINFDLNKYISLTFPNTKIKEVIVGNINYFSFIKDEKIIKDYLIFKLVESCGIFLSDDIEKINFNFYGRTISGIKKNKPKTIKIINIISKIFYDYLGIEYCKKYFPKESKYYVIKMIKNIKITMAERLKKIDWMSESTKQKALLKLKSMKYWVGYPKKIRNYSKLKLSNNIFTQMLLINEYLIKMNFKKINKKPDIDNWSMGAHEINAYYNPVQNEMVFPAGILQPPFFNIKKSDAYNYGTIGFIIGHEICHGFDDQGRSFDEKGNLKNWWNHSDEIKYKAKIKLLQKHFDNIKLENNKINGALTLGENIADLCGGTIAFNALKKTKTVLTLNDKKEFFISYAKLWRQKIRSKELSRLIKSDVHSPGILRVNEVLKHMDEFYEIFDITKHDKMYIKPVNRVNIF